MVRYYSHHREAEALREALQDMRCAAAGMKGKRTDLLIRHAERMERISRASVRQAWRALTKPAGT